MVINTDTFTTITGGIAAISASLAGYGIFTEYTVPAAGISGTLFAILTKGITFSKN
tara:strand:- start:33 stop:200 length:168 start_codon:yes stop_codon:yes gene_type:complete